MKRTLLSLILLACSLLISAQSDNPYFVEDTVYSWFEDRSEEIGFNLDSALTWQEERLLEAGVFSERSDAEFFHLFEDWYLKTYNPALSAHFIDSIATLIHGNQTAEEVAPSFLYMDAGPDFLEQLCADHPDSKFCLYLQSNELDGADIPFTPRDFNHPLYRLMVHVLIWVHVQVDDGLSAPLPEEDEYSLPPIPENRILHVVISENNQIEINEQILPTSEVRERVKDFLTNAEPPVEQLINGEVVKVPACRFLVVAITANRETPYDIYMTVLNEIHAAYSKLRNEVSLEIYELPYDELEEESRRVVRTIVPRTISEAEIQHR